MKNWLWVLLKLALSVVLLIFFVSRVDLGQILQKLSDISLGLFLILLILNVAGVYLNAYKWRMLLPDARIIELLRACFASYYYSLLLPGQLVQEAAKAYSLGQVGAISMHKIAASVVVDKVASILGLLIVSLVGLAMSSIQLSQFVWIFFLSGCVVASVALFILRWDTALKITNKICDQLESRYAYFGFVFSGIKRIVGAWQEYSGNPGMLGRNVLLSVCYQLTGVIMFYLISIELQLQIGFFDWCWVIGVLTLALFLPLTIGGLGVREGTLIGVLGLLGCSKEVALVISLLAFGFTILLAILGFIFVYTRIGKNMAGNSIVR